MADAIIEKVVCQKCGAGVRDGTTFCYNCGSSVAGLSVADEAEKIETNVDAIEPASTSDGFTETIKLDAPDGDKLSRAADQRRKSRASLRKPKEYTWEPADDFRTVLLIALLIAAIALGVVFVAVFWK